MGEWLQDWVIEISLAVVAALGGAGSRMYKWLAELKDSHKELKESHEALSRNVLANREIVHELLEHNKEQTQTGKHMVHYMKWLAEQQTGKAPPPPSD